MKNLKLLSVVFIALFLCSSLQAQPKEMNEELNKIRKQKFMEKIQVDETVTDKYFTLFDDNFKTMMSLNKDKREAMKYIEKNLDASDVSAKMDEVVNIDYKILDLKKSFLNELKTFMTPKQIAQSFIFQKKFNDGLKKEVNKKKKKRDN